MGTMRGVTVTVSRRHRVSTAGVVALAMRVGERATQLAAGEASRSRTFVVATRFERVTGAFRSQSADIGVISFCQ